MKLDKQHSLYRAFPGKVAIDIWGWTGTVSYQRDNGNVTPEYFIENIVKESNIWGANFIEYMPFKIGCGGYVMDWDPMDPIKMPARGAYFFPDPLWGDEAIRGMLKKIHDFDMISSFVINSIGATWEKNPGWKQPTESIENDVMERWSRDFFNIFLYGREKAFFDVLDTEKISGMEIPVMWTYNPGATPMYCAANDDKTKGYTFSFCCAGLKRNSLRGLDDYTSYHRSELGPYFSYQADSRPRRSLHPWGYFGGYSYPDWLMKQIFDFCRVRETSGNNFHTALWWFHETTEMQDPVDRRYVYGLSLDPLRSAVALRLFVTGRFNENALALNPKKIGGLECYPYPRGASIIQNNHLRLYLSQLQDRKMLVYDRKHLGEYDDTHPHQQILSNSFLKTSVKEPRNSLGVFGFIDGSGDGLHKLWTKRSRKMSLEFNVEKDGRYVVAIAQCRSERDKYISIKVDGTALGKFNLKHIRHSVESHIFFVSFKVEKGAHKLDFGLSDPTILDAIDAVSVQPIDYIGTPDNSNTEFKLSGMYGGPGQIYQFQKGIDDSKQFPGGLEPQGKKWPQTIDLDFDANIGLHVLFLRVGGKGPLEFFLDGERILVETVDLKKGSFGDLPLFFGITSKGRHRIRITTWADEIVFDAIGFVRLFDGGITQRIAEPAGYLARTIEELSIPTLSGNVRELRQYTMKDDAPWIEVQIEREITGSMFEICSVVGCEGYDSLHIGGSVYDNTFELNEVPDVLMLRDNKKIKPDMMLTFFGKGNMKSISFEPRRELRITSAGGSRERIKYAIIVPEVLYSSRDIDKHFRSIIGSDERPINFNRKVTVSNKLGVPAIRVITLKGGRQGPFYVMEKDSKNKVNGWWMFRGGNPAMSGEKTYLRIYLQENGSAEIQSYGYIDGKVKGGIGTQYIMAIRDDIEDNLCVVNVFNVTPYVFAPGVVFKKEFTSVKVNGEDWRYYEGNTIYLPNRAGIYEIATSTKEEKAPHILRTQALVKKARWDNGALKVDIENAPEHTYTMPYYTAGIGAEGYRIESISNGGEAISFDESRLKGEGDLEKMQKTAL